MNLVEKYKLETDKITFFRSLTQDEQKEILSELSDKEIKELLSQLSFYAIKDLLEVCDEKERLAIYKNIESERLRAIYDSYPEAQKQAMLSIIEEHQRDLNDKLENARENINMATSDIEKSANHIETSQINIAKHQNDIKIKKQQMKETKAVLKQLSKEQKKALKAVMKAQKKASPLKLANRIGIISKHRTKKLIEKLKYLEEKNQAIDTTMAQKAQISEEINELKSNITQEKQSIAQEQQNIKNAKASIQTNTTNIQKTNIQIKKLSKSEKQMLGRKLYNKTVLTRDAIIVRKKKNKQVTIQQQTIQQQPIQQQPIQQQPIQQQTIQQQPIQQQPIQQQPIQQQPVQQQPNASNTSTKPSNQSTEETVEQLVSNSQELQNIGVNFYQPTNPIDGIQPPNLTSAPIAQITTEQLIMMHYTMMTLYTKHLAQQMKEQQNLSQLPSRTNSHGTVNLLLLINIIIFSLSLILFLSK